MPYHDDDTSRGGEIILVQSLIYVNDVYTGEVLAENYVIFCAIESLDKIRPITTMIRVGGMKQYSYRV